MLLSKNESLVLNAILTLSNNDNIYYINIKKIQLHIKKTYNCTLYPKDIKKYIKQIKVKSKIAKDKCTEIRINISTLEDEYTEAINIIKIKNTKIEE